jgi:hypothetical protein
MRPNAFNLYATRRTPISKLVLSSGVAGIGNKLRYEHVTRFGNPQEIYSCCLLLALQNTYETGKLCSDSATQYYTPVAELIDMKDFMKKNKTFMSRDSSVRISMTWGLDGQGSIPRKARYFFAVSRPALGLNQLPIQWASLFPRG